MSGSTSNAFFPSRVAHRPRRSNARRRSAAARVATGPCEALELRTLLTSTLYLDYGDNWPGGVLNTTVGAIDDTTNGSNPNIDGPRLSDAAGNNYADAATVAITSINTLLGASAGLRSVVRRRRRNA